MEYFHTGIIVEDIELAREELGRALGLHFAPAHQSTYDGKTIEVCYSREGPPYVELIQGAAGSHWDTAPGARMDHLGYWSEDLEADMRTLEENGLAVDIDGIAYGGRFSYHRTVHSGLRVELVDISRKESIEARTRATS